MVLRVSHCACACGERAATAKMTSLLLVLAAFLAFSEAVSPPNLADTFIATGEVEIHTAEGTSIGGKFTIARDQKDKMGLEEIEYGGTNQIAKMVQRYDQKKTYYVRGNVGQEHCIEEESNGQLATFFDWLTKSTYEGKKKYHEVDYDLYGYTLADIRYEVAVDVDGKTPVLFNRYTAEYFVLFSIMNFNATTPPASMFVPPKECSPGTRPQKLYKP